jgi:hypothetical protein
MKFAALLATLCLAVHAQPQNWDLAIAANGSETAEIAPGWPVVLRATASWILDDAAGGPAFDTFDPALAVWKVSSSSGVSQKWQITALGGPRQKTRIDGKNDLISVVWGIAPEQTAAAKGDYLVLLTVGKAQAKARIRVNPASANTDGQNESKRRFVFAEYDLFKGDGAVAIALMQQELQAHPDNASAMSLAARALEKLDRKPEALSMLRGALDLVEKQQGLHPGPGEPVPDLRRRYSALLKEVIAHPASPPAQPRTPR